MVVVGRVLPVLPGLAAATCREVKGRGLPACRVSGVHILGRHKAPHPPNVPVLARLKQIPQWVPRGDGDGLLRPECAPRPGHGGQVSALTPSQSDWQSGAQLQQH